jgi:hypothetical protein
MKPKRKTARTATERTGYSFSLRSRRNKSDWAGISIADAFKQNIDYFHRAQAQRLFYRQLKKAVRAVAKLDGTEAPHLLQPRVKPQLSPCYSSYPAGLAVYASIGLTAFLEFKARISDSRFLSYLNTQLGVQMADSDVRADPELAELTAHSVANWMHSRLLIEDLARRAALSAIEVYRLFATAQEDLRFATVDDIIRAVILYGDVLCEPWHLNLHPLTARILRDLIAASAPFYERLPEVPDRDLLEMGAAWSWRLMAVLLRYLPPPGQPEEKQSKETRKGRNRLMELLGASMPADESIRSDSELAPFDGPVPPVVNRPENPLDWLMNQLTGGADRDRIRDADKPAAVDDGIYKTLEEFQAALGGAAGQSGNWEDMRSDLLENSLRAIPFAAGPIEGNPADGHEVKVSMYGDERSMGELFDRPVAPSDDAAACHSLVEEAAPLTATLRQNLYPNIEQRPEIQRLRCSGGLDGARLPLAEFSETVFRRYRIREVADPRGSPVLVIACDGSGSLNEKQMRMVKLLSAAYLQSTARSSIQVLAALYHSGDIRPGVSGPLVQWMYHPRKSIARSRQDAVRSVVTLPDTGTGVQSDALSIAFIMDEARRIARGHMIYLVLITDTSWNRSFNRSETGADEVRGYFEDLYERFPGQVHTTLVALGVSAPTGFEDLLNAVIGVTHEELSDSAAVAEKVGVYVARCIRERTRLIARA